MENDDKSQRLQDQIHERVQERINERIARQQERWTRRKERWARKQERWARKHERWGRRQHRWRGSPAHGIVFSVAVIAIGALFLLDNLGIVSFHEIARYWPVILIALGTVRLVDSHGTASIVFGGILAGVGGLLLLDNLNIIYFDWRIFWPAVLIGVGVLMLLRTHQWQETREEAREGGPPPDPSRVNIWTMFGGGERRIDAKDFRGGEISAMFGGFEVDLRAAAMADSAATIDVSLMFGGVEIQIPEAWVVDVKGSALFGAFVDETNPPQTRETAPRLIITGYIMFGGVTITN
jgi:predicted membrane protein